MKIKINSLKKIIKEEVIKGRKLDWYSTLISREIINAVKDEQVRNYFSKNGRAYFMMDIPHITKNLEWLDRVYLQITPESHGINAHASYEYDLDATDEQRKNSDMKINLEMPIGYSDKYISVLIPILKETIRHELEHSGQSTDVLMDVQKKVPDQEIWKSLKRALDYYTSEAETKAHVAGIVKLSKVKKINAADAIDDYLVRVWSTGKYFGYSEKDLDPLMKRIRSVWQYYLMTRWPKQEWPEEHR